MTSLTRTSIFITLYVMAATINLFAQHYPPVSLGQYSFGGSDDDIVFTGGISRVIRSSVGHYVIPAMTKSPDGNVRGYHVEFCFGNPCSDLWMPKINGETEDTIWTSRVFFGEGVVEEKEWG